jgi:hypothetical protein
LRKINVHKINHLEKNWPNFKHDHRTHLAAERRGMIFPLLTTGAAVINLS